MDIQIDTREKPRAIANITKTFDNMGVRYYTSKLYVGDYMSLDNPRLIIDRKHNLTELCCNVCQGHDRMIAELNRAKVAGIKLVYLIEHGGRIDCLEAVKTWYNPRLKVSPKAMTGKRLYRALTTISQRYETEFLFCKKADTGQRIIAILCGETYEAV